MAAKAVVFADASAVGFHSIEEGVAFELAGYRQHAGDRSTWSGRTLCSA